LSIAVNLKSMSLRIPAGSLHALTYFLNIPPYGKLRSKFLWQT